MMVPGKWFSFLVSGRSASPIADAHEEGWYRNVLVEIVPVQPGSSATDDGLFALCRRCAQQAREVGERDAELASIRDAFLRNTLESHFS